MSLYVALRRALSIRYFEVQICTATRTLFYALGRDLFHNATLSYALPHHYCFYFVLTTMIYSISVISNAYPSTTEKRQLMKDNVVDPLETNVREIVDLLGLEERIPSNGRVGFVF